MLRRIALASLLLMATPSFAQWIGLATPGVPRTGNDQPDLNAPTPVAADGRPDLSGVWVPDSATGSLFDADKIQGWALDAMASHASNFHVDDPRFHCLPSGPGSYTSGAAWGGQRRIVQQPSFIAVLNSDMTYRQIYLDGRELEAEPLIPSWLGYSVGRWEGDTLVVESNGFNDKTWLTHEGLEHTEQLRITERYTRHDYGHMTLEITYADPGTFREAVQATINLLNSPDAGMLESVCNESETGRSHYTGELSEAQDKLVELPLATLQKYAGTYEGVWLRYDVTAEFAVEDGELVLVRTLRLSGTGGGTDTERHRLVAQSETAFDCTCGLGFIFELDESGNAIEVGEVHVSGSWPFARVP
jgi:hypothetical protein